jgi:hypothetical protein
MGSKRRKTPLDDERRNVPARGDHLDVPMKTLARIILFGGDRV